MAQILALDLGSTQLKLLVMDEKAQVVYVDTQRYSTRSICAGWLEQDPKDWKEALKKGIQKMWQSIDLHKIEAISFSGHMSGIVVMDTAGSVLHPCIMLSDSRSEAQCKRLRSVLEKTVREKTGNPIINAFSLPKLCWLKETCPEIWKRTAVWLSPKDYLRYCLTQEFFTEYTDAYNSLCIDCSTGDWDEEIIAAAGLEKEKFPPVLRPFDKAGSVSTSAEQVFGIPKGIPVFAGGADMACGAVGTGLYHVGESALTLGTCATFLVLVPQIDHQVLGDVTYHMHICPDMFYALGSHFNGGLAVNWLSSVLHEGEKLDFALINALSTAARAVPAGCNGLLTLPFLAGSGSPYFSAADRQTVLGLSTATTRAEIFKSEIEGITFNIAQIKAVFERIVSGGLKSVRLGGGGSKICIWPQIIADVFDKPIDLIENEDASTVGAAVVGGFGVGIFSDLEDAAKKYLRVERVYMQDRNAAKMYKKLYQKYLQAYHVLHEFYAQKEF